MSLAVATVRTKPLQLSVAHLASAALTLTAIAFYAAVSVFRQQHFGSNAYDLGIQDQTVWGYSRLQMMPNTVEMIPNLLGDHFNPILMVLAPFYWVADTADVLLVAQAVLLGLAGIPVYLWGTERLGSLAGLAFQFSYLSFWGVLAGVVYDFHHVVFAVAAVSGALYATLTRRDRLLVAMVAVGFLTREDVPLTLLALGLYIALVQRRLVMGGLLMAASAGWFLLLMQVVMPALAGAPYRHWTYSDLGPGPLSAAAHVLRNPLSSLQLLFTPLRKAEVWVGLFGGWLLLPVLSPLVIVLLPSLLERFWSSDPKLWSFHFQYSMLEAPILAFCAIDSVARLRSWIGPRLGRLAAGALALALAVFTLATTAAVVRPLAEVSNYVTSSTASEIQSCLDVIPAGASVSASNYLLPHLSHRRQIYLITTRDDADYIAIDTATYRHWGPGEEAQLRNTLREKLADGYGVACSRGSTAVLRRGGPDKALSPELVAWLSEG